MFISQMNIRYNTSPKAREFFASFLQKGSVSVKLACLSRLKAVFREPLVDMSFQTWAIPLLVHEISIAARVTGVVVDILYENTKEPRATELLIKALKEDKEKVIVLTRLEEARFLIYRLISFSEGFALFDEVGDYLTNEFKLFMVGSEKRDHVQQEQIYDYMNQVEDGLAVRIMMNPTSILTQPVMLEEDPSLLVQPLKIQPPTHVVFSYLEGGDRRLEWLCQIPWRIEVAIARKNDA